MIMGFNSKYINEIYNLGNKLNNNYSNLYNEESLNTGVNKTFLYVIIVKHWNKKIIIINDQLVGFIHIQDLIDEIDIINIIINENYRRKGYASKLLDYVISILNNKKLILEVSSLNIPAINLYKKYGFEQINVRKGYYSGSDALIMEKKWKYERCIHISHWNFVWWNIYSYCKKW